ncbi:c-type cytochrome [Ilyomonas limi]|uniref:C-type cytochrome n=2 Tax=Ilyomonas limi TaxID=2575867 RepID=A0A4U3LBD5_9BACT|nr:c-type cytochrome [Ilyomonas limi]
MKYAVACYALIAFAGSCKNSARESTHPDSLAIRKSIAEAPQLSPEESIKKMHIEDGFAVKLVASEPLVTAPVAMSWDDKGRIWVVDMQDYMPDTVGTGEDQPTGKVVILADTNGDGVMDKSNIFLDSLVLPRAICLIENGILVAEPPKLWYYDIVDDKPVNKRLIDSAYAEGGNVEHQPNGLFRALDNWIYNAKSAKRYRKEGDRWLIERTHFRGQWGITQDAYGRLFYNTNSENLLGDYFSPGLGAENKNQKSVAGYVTKVVDDNRVYPVRPTPGVNRGYMEGVLDDSLRLVNFTAACGPVIYKGNAFGDAYQGNAFVAEPSANLIKRNIITDKGYIINGEEAYKNKEFLASEDERFRPVNLSNGPDGALYVVDMYRGIIQHKTYLTPYLKNEIKERSLTQPLNCGRIYKIVPENKTLQPVQFTDNTAQLVQLLQHPNGWVRSKAQQLLIDKKDKSATVPLRQLLQNTAQPLPLIHALWTMEGLGVLGDSDVMPLLKQNDWTIRMQALSVLPSVINKSNYAQYASELEQMANSNDTLAAPYIAFLTHDIQPYNAGRAKQLLLTLTEKYPDNVYVADAIISNLQDKEAAYYAEIRKKEPDTSLVINKRLSKVIADIAKAKNNSNVEKLAKLYPKGATIFRSLCQTCHGTDGNGVTALAPPLNGSNWVQGDKNRLIPIVLYGLTGPVTVAGKTYKAPEISGDMPGIGANKEFTDKDIAQVLSYVRNAWNNKAEKITAADVSAIREKYKDRQKTFTMEELNGIH